MPRGIPTVDIDITGDNHEEALREAHRLAAQFVNAFSLIADEQEGIRLGTETAPILLPNGLLMDPEAGTADVSFYGGTVLGRMNVGATGDRARGFNDRVVRHIGNIFPVSLADGSAEVTGIEARIADVLYWHSQAKRQNDAVVKFVSYWLGLEGLLFRSANTSNRGQRLKDRLGRVLDAHRPSPYPRHELEELWETRSKVLHEGFGRPDVGVREEVTGGLIGFMEYAFIVTLLYTLDQYNAGRGLHNLWYPEAHYQPSMVVPEEDMPIVWHIANVRRHRVAKSQLQGG